MKKIIVLLLALLLVGCAAECPEAEIVYQEKIVEVEKEVEVEITDNLCVEIFSYVFPTMVNEEGNYLNVEEWLSILSVPRNQEGVWTLLENCVAGGWVPQEYAVMGISPCDENYFGCSYTAEPEVETAPDLNNTAQDVITKPGQYLVPEQMKPGQWSYVSNVDGGDCWVSTYRDLSGTSESKLDNLYSENQGFFRLNENVRMAEITSFSDCVFSRIGD